MHTDTPTPDHTADPSGTGSTASWRSLVPYLRRHAPALVGVQVLSFGAVAAGLALPMVAGQLVDDLSGQRPVAGRAALLVVLALSNAALSGLSGYLLSRIAESTVLGVRRALISHLVRLRVGALDRHEPGDLSARVTSDSVLLRDLVTTSLIGGVTGVVMLVGVVVMMGSMDPVLLTVALLTMAGASSVMGMVTRRINRSAVQAQEAVGAVGAALERMFGAFRTVKANGAEGREEAGLHRVVTTLWRASVQSGGWSAVAGSVVELAAQVAFLGVLVVGGVRVASGAIGIGTLVAFLIYVFMLVPPVSQVVQASIKYQTGLAGLARITQVTALAAESVGVSPPAEAVGVSMTAAADSAAVSFEDVRFRYPPAGPRVHRGLSFRIPPCGLTAIVGGSGEGKTTIFSLIERFYDADEGRVLVHGRDVRDWPLDDLRATIGYVEQEATGLSGTLRENLVYGVPDAAEASLYSVLRQVRLSELVASLPQGLDTPIGHRGGRFSGGERQRLAIARALLRQPRLLLLDEATSQLDAVNETALRDTVAELAQTTTVLVIAHRLSTVVLADRIILVDGGRVRAVGSHADLVETDARYANLAATQLLHRGGRRRQSTQDCPAT